MRADRTTWIRASHGGPFGRRVVLAALSGLALMGAGCQQATPPAEPAVSEMSHADHSDAVDPAVVAAEMAKLSPEDREQAISCLSAAKAARKWSGAIRRRCWHVCPNCRPA